MKSKKQTVNKNDDCLIAVVLDRSGSMQSVKSDTIGGFNKFLEEQKKLPGKCKISLYQFDDVYEIVYENKNIKDAPELTDKTFIPRGWTALLDAIGKTVNSLNEKINNLNKKDKPSKIIIVIQTDGAENSSKEYTREKVFELIKEQKDKNNWQFIFLGANQDAITTAVSYGISKGSTLTYAANSVGTQNVYRSLNTNISNYRSNLCYTTDFSEQDRKVQEEELNKTYK